MCIYSCHADRMDGTLCRLQPWVFEGRASFDQYILQIYRKNLPPILDTFAPQAGRRLVFLSFSQSVPFPAYLLQVLEEFC